MLGGSVSQKTFFPQKTAVPLSRSLKTCIVVSHYLSLRNTGWRTHFAMGNVPPGGGSAFEGEEFSERNLSKETLNDVQVLQYDERDLLNVRWLNTAYSKGLANGTLVRNDEFFVKKRTNLKRKATETDMVLQVTVRPHESRTGLLTVFGFFSSTTQHLEWMVQRCMTHTAAGNSRFVVFCSSDAYRCCSTWRDKLRS
jgi:hypothetical protein